MPKSKRQKFVTERVFPPPAAPPARAPDIPSSSSGAPVVEALQSIALLGHSVMDDLRIRVHSPATDLDHDFALNVSPVWNTIRGMNFSKLKRDCLDMLDATKPDVIILQLVGNDIDSLIPVWDIAEDYVKYARLFRRHCHTKVVIICEPLPRTKTRTVSPDEYYTRRKAFNEIMTRELIRPGYALLEEDMFTIPGVWFWKHEKLQGPAQLRDGVHLTNTGTRRLYFSMKMVLAKALGTH